MAVTSPALHCHGGSSSFPRVDRGIEDTGEDQKGNGTTILAAADSRTQPYNRAQAGYPPPPTDRGECEQIETDRESSHNASSSALVRASQPWSDAFLAHLYDAFPFDADLPLYRELAARGGNVLELACGSGRVLVPLAEAGNRVTGLDASPHMLALATEKLSRKGPEVEERVRLAQGDIRSFDLHQQFDLAIIAVKSFAYLTERSDQQRALHTIAAHLRPGGLLALDLLHPSPAWLMEPPGSLRQDLVETVPAMDDATVARTEAVVRTDLAAQVRVIRSAYEVVARDGSLTKRFVEWPFRYTYRFEAELLLERAGFEIDAVYGGYQREPFTSESRVMLLVARCP